MCPEMEEQQTIAKNLKGRKQVTENLKGNAP